MSHLMAALALAAGLALAPASAYADEQTPGNETQQEETAEAIRSDEGVDGLAIPQEAGEGGVPDVAEAVSAETDACLESSDRADAASEEDTTEEGPSEVSPEVQADANTDEAVETEQETAADAEHVDSPTLDDATEGNEVIADSQLEGTDDAGDADEPPAATKTADSNTRLSATATNGATTPTLKAQTASNHQSVSEGTYVIESGIRAADGNGLAKLVLDARGGAHDGAEVITWSYTGNANQKWRIALVADNWYTIASLADESLVLTATKDSGKLYLTKRVEGLASQLWAFMLSGRSYGTGYQLVPQGLQQSATDTTIVYDAQDRALDVRYGKPTRGADVITYTQSDAVRPNQSFYLVDPAPQVKAGRTDMEGRYRVYVPDTQNVIEVRRASSANGANIWTYTASGKANQDIYLQYENNGFYSLWVMGTKKVLGVQGGSVLPGANVVQWAYTGRATQLWAVRDNGDGTFSFVNKATGLALGGASEANGKFGAGTNLVGAQDNGRANNAFSLKRVCLLTSGIYKMIRVSDSYAVDVKGSSIKSGTRLGFYKDCGKVNQRFELVSAGKTDNWRIRTASSGGWVSVNSLSQIIQQGSSATKQNNYNIWHVLWRNGSYQFRNEARNRFLGTSSAKLKMVKAPIALATGLFEIDSKAAKVALDNPKNSTSVGTRISVYADKNGANQRFYVEKHGSGYRLVNLVSDLALTASGSSVIQQKFTGAASQVWIVGIADGGYLRLINSSTKKALDITGTGTVSSSKSTALRTSASSADREARQSWKLVRMPLPIYERMAQVAIHFADHSAHGYSQPNRGTGGSETITLRDGSKVTISNSDVDCSEMVRQCVCAAFGRNVIPFMWTGIQYSCMMGSGFKLISFDASKVRRGDILWRLGHTCIALDNTNTSEAFGSELHDVHGARGDQTGSEVTYGTVGTDWTYIYRWVKVDAK